MNALRLISLIGVILGLVALVLAWETFTSSGNSVVTSGSASGFEGLSEGYLEPVVFFIGLLLALALVLLEFMGKGQEISRAVLILAGFIMILGAALVFKDDGYTIVVSGFTVVGKAGIGAYLGIVVGLIMLLAPILSALKALPKN
jgi:hypothetical protein